MRIETLVVGQLETNCYLVWDPESLEAIIIDPGDAGDYIGEKILSLNLKPKLIVATHGHFDHILAVTELKLAFNISFLIHPKDEFLVRRVQRSAKFFVGIQTDLVPKIDQYLKKEEEIKFGREKLKVMETAGHTPGSVCLTSYSTSQDAIPACAGRRQPPRFCRSVLFSGDTLFAGGVGRTDFGYSSQKDLTESLEKIFTLPEETIVYPGHGELTTIGEEKRVLK